MNIMTSDGAEPETLDTATLASALRRLLEAAAGDGPTSARRQLGADALLTLAEVVRLVPGRTDRVREWVEGHVRARRGPTQPLYRWGDVVSAMPAGPLPGDDEAPPAPSTPVLRAPSKPLSPRRGTRPRS